MKRIICAGIILGSLLSACNSKSGGGGGDQSTPKGVAEMVFSAAKSGNYDGLKNLCDPSLEPDGDSKHVCEVADAEAKHKDEFKQYFSTGKVVGEPEVEGDNAKVNISFGPDGKESETFVMKKKDGKWYLVSF